MDVKKLIEEGVLRDPIRITIPTRNMVGMYTIIGRDYDVQICKDLETVVKKLEETDQGKRDDLFIAGQDDIDLSEYLEFRFKHLNFTYVYDEPIRDDSKWVYLIKQHTVPM